MTDFGTDPHIIHRTDGPDSSAVAAHMVDTASGEKLVYEIIESYGLEGCVLDQLKADFRKRAGIDTQYVNRRTGLHQKGRVLVTHIKRKGTSGAPQYVYVARDLLQPEWIQWMKENHGWLNPCLFGKDEAVPVDPMKAKNLIKDLANDLALSIFALMQEVGAVTEEKGKPLATDESALGRACAYLKKPVPLCPDYGEDVEEI